MRRNARRREEDKNIWEDKRVIISSVIIATAIAIIVGFTMFSSNAKNSKTSPNQIISLEPEQNDNLDATTESASSSIGNTVKEVQEQNNTSVNNNTLDNTNSASKQNTVNTIENKKTNTTEANTTSKKETTTTNSTVEENKKISFNWPIKGEILKAFSMDNLLYSATLQEWTTHNGIDIKADKASVVSASADGTVKSIKNDPRYGLTVTVEHTDGYKTVYANLLTAEFVVEGEKIKQGQSIGTVGNTANFEISDGFHLHFEILKDSESVDPMIYLK